MVTRVRVGCGRYADFRGRLPRILYYINRVEENPCLPREICVNCCVLQWVSGVNGKTNNEEKQQRPGTIHIHENDIIYYILLGGCMDNV